MNETKEERNIKIYPIYKMLSWDLLFYYSINFIFLTQIKRFSASDVLLTEAFYPIFKVVLLMPLTALSYKLGKRKSLIIANMINVFSILSYIVAQNLTYVLIGQLLSAIAYNIKGIVETNLLYDSLPKNEKRGHLFSKVDGKGSSWYYYMNAITSIASGFLYIINGYLPFILCLICCVISTILSFKFEDISKTEEKKLTTKQYLKSLKHSFKYMIQSKRLKCLFVFGAVFSALLSLVSLRSGILEQLQVPEQYFGIIFAILEIISGISAKNQNKIHNRYRNKTLGVLSIPTAISCIILGFFMLGKLSFSVILTIILALFLIQYIAKGAFHTLIKRYLNNFTTSSLRNKITLTYNLVESLARALITLLASMILKITTASNTILVIGCITTIIIVLMIDYMKDKVGLKPEEYSKKEVEFIELH